MLVKVTNWPRAYPGLGYIRSNLEILAEKHGVILLFWPKFHCELNSIESVWCFIKQYIRRKTDRTFETMVHLIEEAKVEFKEGNLNAKLWRRFWQAINMIKNCHTSIL